jgi:hypothetical protein
LALWGGGRRACGPARRLLAAADDTP